MDPERTETDSEQQQPQGSEPENTQSLETEPLDQQQEEEEDEQELPLEKGDPEQHFGHEATNQTLSEPQDASESVSLESELQAEPEQETQPVMVEEEVVMMGEAVADSAAEVPDSKPTSTSVPAETPLEMTTEGIIACPQHAHMVAPGQCECQHGYELNVLTDTCEASLLEVEEELGSSSSVLESSARHSPESRSI